MYARRTKKNREFVLVLNHSSEEKDVDVPLAGHIVRSVLEAPSTLSCIEMASYFVVFLEIQ